MVNLVLSVMKQENAGVGSLLQPVLDQFQKETGITVELKTLDWSDGQEVLLRTILYGDELNVSEVGTSWVSSFLGMNGLQPFTDRDIRMIGSPNDFLDVVWESGKPPGRNRLWAIPWAAVTIGGHGLLHSEREISSSQVIDNLGVAPLPGLPFVGGSNLVI